MSNLWMICLLLCDTSQAFYSNPARAKTFENIGRSSRRKRIAYGKLNESMQEASPRWRGGHKPSIQKLSDIPKKKKHTIQLIADGETKEFKKKKYESLQHVLTKGILWKIFKEEFDNIQIETDIGDPNNYLPDVIALNSTTNVPLFWGESGRMKVDKAVKLAQRYPNMHICQLRWGVSLDEYVPDMLKAVRTVKREGKYSFGAIPNKNVWEYFDEKDGTIHMTKDMVEWYHLDQEDS